MEMWRLGIAVLLSTAFVTSSVAAGAVTRLSERLLGRGVDHVLLWTRDADHSSRFLERQLGFQVRPGGSFPGDVANRLIMFSDASYLELLFYTAPLDSVSLQGLEFLRERNGSNAFGIAVASLEETADGLARSGFSPDVPTAGSYDPDGPEGPQPTQDSIYRTFGFRQAPLPGLDPFFVWYRPRTSWTAENQTRRNMLSRHRNTAERLSAVWITVPDPDGASAVLLRMGMTRGPPAHLPDLQARAVPFSAGRSIVFLLIPSGEGHSARQLRLRGAHVAGLSVEVADLDVAAHVLRMGAGQAPRRVFSPFGRAIRTDTTDELGLFIEFYE